MAVIEVQPLLMKDVELIIGDALDDYRKHASTVRLVPSSSPTTWTGLGRNTHTAQAESTWVLELTYAQDWDSPDSLSRFLYENEGEKVPIVIRPRAGTGPSFSVVAVITPGAIGGSVNSYAESTSTLGLDGRPELVPAA